MSIRDSRARRSGSQALIGVLAAVLGVLALALAACATSTTPSATDLLKQARDKWTATNTLHFNMKVEHPGSGSINTPYPTSAEGDVKRPDALNARSTVDVGLGSFNVNLIILSNDEWYTNPLTNTYQKTDDFGSFLKIFDSEVGLGSLLTSLQNPSAPSDSSANGTPCYKITGTLSPDKLKPLFGDITATGPVPTTFCIGKDDKRLYMAALSGQVTTGDRADTVRTFYLSKFDAPVTVTPPPGA